MAASIDQQATRVPLAGDWRIGRLQSQQQLLQAALQDAPVHIELDAAELTHIDTLGLQLLAVFVQQCLRRQIGIHWASPPALLAESAARLGLSGIMALPTDRPA